MFSEPVLMRIVNRNGCSVQFSFFFFNQDDAGLRISLEHSFNFNFWEYFQKDRY